MAKIGKYVIDSLTRSMYEDSRCIFREYIQNAADQIDLARKEHLDEDDHYEIHVRIFREQRRIEIEDTATGVSRENRDTLKDVATSQKRRGEHKGFRGIGRLGGLGYCTTLIFETSAKGEDVKTIMKWDAAKMNKMVDDEDDNSEAGGVIDECTTFEEQPEKPEMHYFKVIMEDVTDDRLLDLANVRNYLSMVSPVDYPTQFNRFSAKIKKYAKENGITLDTYNLYLGDEYGEEQIFKAYTTKVIDSHNGDYDIKDIMFFDKRDNEGNLIYWGWYSISELRGQIPMYNVAYGMRLRCKNIQVGDERTCRNFFSAEGDKRFSQWFYGEVFVETKELMPDARRDYLRECEFRSIFENYIKIHFLVLKELCKEASDIRGAQKDIKKAVQEQNKIEKKKQTGYLSSEDQKRSEQKFEEFKQKKEKAQQKLVKLQNDNKEKKSPLGFIFDNDLLGSSTPSIQPVENQENEPAQTLATSSIEYKPEKGVNLRTDNVIYHRFTRKEKLLINTIYNTIYNAFADEDMRESLIKKIERELTK